MKAISKQRFIEGSGQRYLKDGKTIRCQAISRAKAKRLRQGKHRDEIPASAFWPMLQCHRKARSGYYVCPIHGGGRVSAPGPHPNRQLKNIGQFLNTNLAEKYLVFYNDPELFSQRNNIALLNARNAELMEQLDEENITSPKIIKKLWKGIDAINAGDIIGGTRQLETALENLNKLNQSWNEFRQNTQTIKDLTNAEINRVKEMRLALTSEQVLSIIDRLLNLVTDTIENNVHDTALQTLLFGIILGGTRELIGSGSNALLDGTAIEAGDDSGDALELD
jgi:hypothetical protein